MEVGLQYSDAPEQGGSAHFTQLCKADATCPTPAYTKSSSGQDDRGRAAGLARQADVQATCKHHTLPSTWSPTGANRTRSRHRWPPSPNPTPPCAVCLNPCLDSALNTLTGSDSGLNCVYARKALLFHITHHAHPQHQQHHYRGMPRVGEQRKLVSTAAFCPLRDTLCSHSR